MNITLAAVRTIATGAITALAVLPVYEPSWTWVPAAIAMAGAIGIHAIPSIGQAPQSNTISTTNTEMAGQKTMTDGLTLMGVTPPPVPSLNPEPAPEAPAEAPPEAEAVPAPLPDAAPAAEQPSIGERMRAAIAALAEVAQEL